MSESTIKRVGIFGGTFDPIHRGHVDTVREVMGLAGLGCVRFIPAARPPHRGMTGATALQRVAMVDIAIGDEDLMVVDDREVGRAGASYTVDTVAELQGEFPAVAFSLILGLDALLQFDSWHRFEDLLGRVNIVAMVRPGWVMPEELPGWLARGLAQPFDAEAGRIALFSVTPNPISATKVRAGMADGTDVREMLHPEVWRYIEERGLYS